jgi:formylglycine-generating enzyme required for sulfatase activity
MMTDRLRLTLVAFGCVHVFCLSVCAQAAGGNGAATTRPVVDKIPRTTVQIEMVRVPEGEITLTEKNGREMTYWIRRPFLIQKTEARWDEWDVFYHGLDMLPDDRVGSKPRERRDAMLQPSPTPYMPYDRGFGHDGWPMHGLTLHTVRVYIEWLNRTTGKRYRLPTEAEWEYACRAGSTEAIRPKGKMLERVAWFQGNSKEEPHRVATKAPNAWGLYDMLGNVGEWVIRSDESAVLAGGSHQDGADDVSSAVREVPDMAKWQRNHPSTLTPVRTWLSDGMHVGFRLVRDLEAGEEK